MKIAVSGKGGVGKSTVAGSLAVMLSERGETVLALDADPDANLARALGIPSEYKSEIAAISEQTDVIEERTGARAGQFGQMFALAPQVSDLAERFAFLWRGLYLLVLGGVSRGGGGCACPENSFIKALVGELVLGRDETLVMDMEAGIEHLGRATAQGVDLMLVVAEPGARSVDCALQVEKMCGDIGLGNLLYIGNKTRGAEDERFLREALGERLVGCIPYSEELRRSDREGVCARDCLGAEAERVLSEVIERLKKEGKD